MKNCDQMTFMGDNKKSVLISRQDFYAYSKQLSSDKSLRYSRTRIAENFAKQYLSLPTPVKSYQLCRFIFKIWASQSGNRVFGNLKKGKSDLELGSELHNAFQRIVQYLKNNEKNCEQKCIETLNKVKGLGTSYSSKLLRILFPDKFATLDSVLREALGYGEDAASYQNFINQIKKFKETNCLSQSISEIEVILFGICLSQKTMSIQVLDSDYSDFNYDFTD